MDDDQGMAVSNEQTCTGNEHQFYYRCVYSYTLSVVERCDADGFMIQVSRQKGTRARFLLPNRNRCIAYTQGARPTSVLRITFTVLEDELFIIIQFFVLHSTQHDNESKAIHMTHDWEQSLPVSVASFIDVTRSF